MNRVQFGLYALLVVFCVTLAWQVQAWRYGGQLAQQAQRDEQQLREQAPLVNRQLLAERDQRLGLEQRLHDSESRHFQELADVQQTQARLRDRLATADLRLSVLVEPDAACAGVPATAAPGGMDHGPVRAGLDPAHARRIIAISDDGDRGLIALRACQDYIRGLQH